LKNRLQTIIKLINDVGVNLCRSGSMYSSDLDFIIICRWFAIVCY